MGGGGKNVFFGRGGQLKFYFFGNRTQTKEIQGGETAMPALVSILYCQLLPYNYQMQCLHLCQYTCSIPDCVVCKHALYTDCDSLCKNGAQ